MEFLEHLAFPSIKKRFHYVEITYIMNAIHASLEMVRFLESRRSQMVGVLHRSPLGLTGEPGPASQGPASQPRHQPGKSAASPDPTGCHGQAVSLVTSLSSSSTAHYLHRHGGLLAGSVSQEHLEILREKELKALKEYKQIRLSALT